MTIRDDGAREQTRPTKPPQKMGPLPRSFAADAHGCIMVWPQAGRPHTSLRRDDQRPAMASSPPIVTHPTKARPSGNDERLTQTAPYKLVPLFSRPAKLAGRVGA